MLLLFINLYTAMFRGTWVNYQWNTYIERLRTFFNGFGEFLTSIFNNVDTPMTTLGNTMFPSSDMDFTLIILVSTILALITSIGIVVMAVKGVKKAFGIFFGHIR